MKREIRFRGKRVGNKEWVEGGFGILGEDTDLEKSVIIVSTLHTNSHIDSFYFTDVEVIPESVSQFTGLKDKNGVEIYEGDIVEFTRAQCRGAYRGSRMAVSYQTYVFCGFGFDKTMALTKKRANECNIIGNIHDNPELLK